MQRYTLLGVVGCRAAAWWRSLGSRSRARPLWPSAAYGLRCGTSRAALRLVKLGFHDLGAENFITPTYSNSLSRTAIVPSKGLICCQLSSEAGTWQQLELSVTVQRLQGSGRRPAVAPLQLGYILSHGMFCLLDEVRLLYWSWMWTLSFPPQGMADGTAICHLWLLEHARARSSSNSALWHCRLRRYTAHNCSCFKVPFMANHNFRIASTPIHFNSFVFGESLEFVCSSMGQDLSCWFTMEVRPLKLSHFSARFCKNYVFVTSKTCEPHTHS